MRRVIIIFFALACLGLSSGCEIVHTPVSLDTEGVEARVDYSMLQETLNEAVTDEGQLVVEIVKRRRPGLLEQVTLLAVTGPTITPEFFSTDMDRLAYWFNARAAWAIELPLRCEFSEDHAGERLLNRPFPLDGRMMTLCDIDAILLGDADLRTVAAAPGVHYDRAAMPLTVFSAEDIRGRIVERFGLFIDDPIRFKINVARKEVQVPSVIWNLRKQYVERHNHRFGTEGTDLLTALTWLVEGSAHRRLQNAVGYRLVGDNAPWCLAALLE
ncbi:MAG TPA: hypothetical protein ENL03_01030 [Phycisphaerae bacterium]|nr:hypothetical protein [Phycisphaerae bacterium]